MRRIIDGNISICNVTHGVAGDNGTGKVSESPAKKKHHVKDMTFRDRVYSKKVAEPLREGMTIDGSNREKEGVSLFSKEEIEQKAKLLESTEDMTPKEQEKFLQSQIKSVTKLLKDRDERGDLEGIKPAGDYSVLFGGAGNSNPQDASETNQAEKAAERLSRRIERKMEKERKKDVSDVMGAIFADTSLNVTKELATIPTAMATAVLLELQKNARQNGDSGSGFEVAIAVIGFLEKAISLPFNLAIKEAQKQEEKFGLKYENLEFLELLYKEQKKSTPSKEKMEPSANNLEYKENSAHDPDEDGNPGIGNPSIGESGNFVGGENSRW